MSPTQGHRVAILCRGDREAITLSSFLKEEDRWLDFHRIAQCAAVASLTSYLMIAPLL